MYVYIEHKCIIRNKICYVLLIAIKTQILSVMLKSHCILVSIENKFHFVEIELSETSSGALDYD